MVWENFPSNLSNSTRLIVVRSLLFCLAAARSSLTPFLPLYFHAWHISPLQFGCLYGTKQLVSAFLLPCVLRIVSKSRFQRFLCAVLILGAFVCPSVLVWIMNPFQSMEVTYCGPASILHFNLPQRRDIWNNIHDYVLLNSTDIEEKKAKSHLGEDTIIKVTPISSPHDLEEPPELCSHCKRCPCCKVHNIEYNYTKGHRVHNVKYKQANFCNQKIQRKYDLPFYGQYFNQYRKDLKGDIDSFYDTPLDYDYKDNKRPAVQYKTTSIISTANKIETNMSAQQQSTYIKDVNEQRLLELLLKIAHINKNKYLTSMFGNQSSNVTSITTQTYQAGLISVNTAYEWGFAILILSDLCMASVQCIAEDAMWDFLESTDLLSQFDKLRKWSALGSFSSSLLFFFVIKFAICQNAPQNPFIFHALISSLFAFLSVAILSAYPVEYFTTYTYHRSAVKSAIHMFTKDIRNAPYLVIAFLIGFLSFGFDVIQIWFLRDVSAPAFLITVLFLVQSCSDFFIQTAFQRWKRPLPPYHWMLCLTLFGIGVHSVFYYFINYLWIFIVVEILYGFSHTLVLVSFEAYAEYVSPPGIERSVRFLLYFFYSGPGMTLGAFLGSIVYTYTEIPTFYVAHAGLTFFLLLFIIPLKFILPRRLYSYSRILSIHHFDTHHHFNDQHSEGSENAEDAVNTETKLLNKTDG